MLATSRARIETAVGSTGVSQQPRQQPSGSPVLLRWFQHPPGTWVDPMQSRARNTLHRLIGFRIIGDRWIIGPSLHLLAGVGAAVDENGHVVGQHGF
jgi:hypothetical protein